MFFNLFCFQSKAQYLQFVENKGQWDKSVKFKAEFKGGALSLEPAGYRVVLRNKDDMEKIADYFSGHFDSTKKPDLKNKVQKFILHQHVYKLDFIDADTNAVVIPDKPLSVANNYFIGNDSTKWKSDCHVYNGVTYKNVYKNVDVRYYSDNGNLKYDIIVNPGADLSKIALKFDGLDGLSLNKYGNLTMKTSLCDIYESIPLSYQVLKNLKNKVKANFDLKMALYILNWINTIKPQP